MSMMNTIFIDLNGVAHDYGVRVPQEGAGSCFPLKDGVRYAPLGSVNNLMIFMGITEEMFQEIKARNPYIRWDSFHATI